MLRAVAAAQGQPREARRAPWTGKAMGREGNQAMCVLQSRLSLLAPGWRWQCPVPLLLSQVVAVPRGPCTVTICQGRMGGPAVLALQL